ncbi:hypothetical protein JHD43_00980 [Aeromonas veronii]|nr:hypothetical protein [Aeromonas veronii]QET81378.1 hypothetical protein FOB40_20205 [Aeromonas veronii]
MVIKQGGERVVDGYDSGCVYLAIEALLSDGEYGAESHHGVNREGAIRSTDISHDFDPANIPLLLAE